MTVEGSHSLEHRLTEALDELRDLARRFDDLATRVGALEAGAPRVEPANATRVETETETEPDESLWSWIGQSRVLPRVAMISFVMVLALVLRTLTDSGAIDQGLGVALGIAYSAGLVVWGWRALRKGRRGRRVIPACGAVLMCTVALEGHGQFQLLSAATANWILIGTLVVLTALGIRYRTGTLVAVAALSTSLSALLLGFPNLQFASAATVLLAANLATLAVSRTPRMQWLPWVPLGLNLFFWLMWSFKLNAALRRPDEVEASLYLPWFLPLLALSALAYATSAAFRAFASPQSPGAFHAIAPTANVLWAYAAALAVVLPWTGSAAALGLVGIALSLAHFGVAAWLWRRVRQCATGITAFMLAGTLLLALAVPSVTGGLLLALPVWSAAALGLAVASGVCGSTGLRVTSYGLQFLTCIFAVASGEFALPSETPVTALVIAGLVAVISAAHYRWIRTHPPAEGTWFTRMDKNDRSAIVLLWAAAVGGFCVLRAIAWFGLEFLGAAADNTFQGVQSAIINFASVGLMIWATRKRDKEVLGTAVMVAVVGGLKVFAVDLRQGSGVPLVLAVFSFGVAAAVGSIVLGKWQGAGAGKDEAS